jgi:hypothetical protein
MFEDEEEISQGYGNASDLMPQDPMGAQGNAQAQGGGGQDPIVSGLTAFMETQDPQIAVEVCNMLAQQMGIGAPAPAPGGNAPMGGGGAPAPASAPMGKNGMGFRPKLF